jgi:hypothetical protein
MKIVYMICKTLCIADLRNVRDNLMKHYRWIWDLNVKRFGMSIKKYEIKEIMQQISLISCCCFPFVRLCYRMISKGNSYRKDVRSGRE